MNDVKNVIWHKATVTRKRREQQNEHGAFVIWFTGLSGAGKSTIAHALEEKLHNMGCRTYVFDGDNVRHGLCSDLGFSFEDRKENIRRIGEMTRLFIDAGIIAMAAFISPYKKDREWVRSLVGKENFIEIFCDCSIEVCEHRDVKGHYAKARKGELPEFTGISAPYEAPEKPDMNLKTDELTLNECVDRVMQYLSGMKLLSSK